MILKITIRFGVQTLMLTIHTHFFLKSAVAFFFLFFLHGTLIRNGQQGISYKGWVFVKCGYQKCLINKENFISHILQIPY
jgi:hypothetical protein